MWRWRGQEGATGAAARVQGGLQLGGQRRGEGAVEMDRQRFHHDGNVPKGTAHRTTTESS